MLDGQGEVGIVNYEVTVEEWAGWWTGETLVEEWWRLV
jgi:hypothetical protein